MFVPPVLTPEAHATDAMSLRWKGMWAYAFPPFPLILPSVKKIQMEECLVCSIAPLWEGQAWFLMLMSLLVAPPIHLPLDRVTSISTSVTVSTSHSWDIPLTCLAAMQGGEGT